MALISIAYHVVLLPILYIIFWFNRLCLYIKSSRTKAPRPQYSDIARIRDEIDRLAVTWRGVKESNMIFLAIDTQLSDIGDRLEVIEVAIWDPRNPGPIECLRWQIINPDNTEKNVGSKTEDDPIKMLLTESQIGETIDDFIRTLQYHCKEIAIICHNVDRTLGTLERYWVPQTSLVLFDTQFIWQCQNGEFSSIMPDDALQCISKSAHGVIGRDVTESSAGKIVQLFRNLGAVAEIFTRADLKRFSDRGPRSRSDLS